MHTLAWQTASTATVHTGLLMMDGWTNDGCTSIIWIKLNNTEPKTITLQQMFAGKIGVDIKNSIQNSCNLHAQANQLRNYSSLFHCTYVCLFFMIVRKEKKWNPFLVKISALLATGKQNILHLLPLVSEKYFFILGCNPTEQQENNKFQATQRYNGCAEAGDVRFFFFCTITESSLSDVLRFCRDAVWPGNPNLNPNHPESYLR